MPNIFKYPPDLGPDGEEWFEPLLDGPDGLLVERIVSHGQTTPEGQWYDQDRDEWVLVAEGTARIGFDDGREVTLNRGDHLFLPRRVRHRVLHTSRPCVWLAIHGGLSPAAISSKDI